MTEPPAPRRAPVLALAVGAALVLLADRPGSFTRGDVLRGAALPLLAAAGALLVATSRSPGRSGRVLFLLLLPALVPLLGLVGLPAGERSGAAALREASPWVALTVLAVAWSLAWRAPGDAVLAWRALLVAGAGAAGWVLVHERVGPFGRPGIAGPVLGSLAAAATAVPLPGVRWARAALVALLLGACAWTTSRAGLLAGAGGVVLAWAAAAPRPVPARARRVLVPAAALAAGVLAALVLAGKVVLPGGAQTAQVRLGLWRASAALVAERPLAGHGIGSLPTEILRRRDPDEARLSLGRRADQAHQEYLRAAVEGGAPAGLALLGWAFGLVALGTVASLRAAGPDRRSLAAGTASLLVLATSALAEEPFRDPAGALVASLAAATVASSFLRPARLSAAGRVALLAAAGVAGACAWAQARAALADHELALYRDAIRAPLAPEAAAALARERLTEGVLAWRPDHAEAHYWLGVTEAEAGRYGRAREAYRRAIEADPGRTEARLDVARTFELEGRPDDAREVLLEARRRDPTRYEVPLRLGHLALGPEPVPGRAPDPAFDPVPATRHYNEAALLAPERFETSVAQARIARRRGDLESAARLLEPARRTAPAAGETLLEEFRQVESGRGATERELVTRLTLAILADPGLAGPVHAEAVRFLDEGERQERAVREGLAGDPASADFTPADRVFETAARRLAAVLLARPERTEAELAAAEAEAEGRRWRRSLAHYRAVLARLEQDVESFGRLPPPDSLARWGGLVLEVAKVAQRVPGSGARALYARGHLILGAEMLARGAAAEARRLFESAVNDDPDSGDAWFGLARALARLGSLDEAERALLKSFALDARKKESAQAEPDLEAVRERPATRAALGG